MSRAMLKFDIVSFWHAGTGRSAGTELDARSQRTPAGLPLLPGKTVRGLLREGLRDAVRLGLRSDPDLEERCFGSGLEPVRSANRDLVAHFEETRFRTSPGAIVFGSAHVGTNLDDAARWESWAATDEGKQRVEHLFRPFASTRLSSGVAEDHTLRAIELVVPLVLVAEVSTVGAGDLDWQGALRDAARFVRGVGSHRNRGLGRVITTLEVIS